MKQNILVTLAGTAAMISLVACVQVPTENTPQVVEQFPLRDVAYSQNLDTDRWTEQSKALPRSI